MKPDLRDSPRGGAAKTASGGKPEFTPRGEVHKVALRPPRSCRPRLTSRDEPKEWRKSALTTALGLALLSSLLRWRHILANNIWLVSLGLFGLMAICALMQPRWFRSYHRLSTRLGLAVSQFLGWILLTLFFFLVLTPVGLVLRLAGKDALQLKRPREAKTHWQAAKAYSPLDRLF